MARNDSIAKMKIETTLSPGFGQSHSNAGPHHHVCQVREPNLMSPKFFLLPMFVPENQSGK